MKISNKQKELNRQKLLRAAVDVIADTGFEESSLRQICKVAQLSEPVIYGYFPNKQSLLFAYWQDSIEQALAQTRAAADFKQAAWFEKVERLMENHRQILEQDMAFVRETFPLVFVNGLATAQVSLAACRTMFAEFANECLNEAIRAEEIVAPPFLETIASMFWDFHVGLLHYWLRDESEMQVATSELMQRSMAVIRELLRSGFLSKTVDLAYFLIRTHLLSPGLKV